MVRSKKSAQTDKYQVFAKPAGAACNLHCSYCYYLDTGRPNSDAGPARMTDELLEEYIVQQMKVPTGDTIRFSWHGGEPTTLGVEYFRKIVSLQQKHAPARKRIINGLVTNGTLLDEEWCEFLASEEFAVGLSLDGPADLHDVYRVTRGRMPTHEKALRAFRRLRRHRVPCDILCVVHNLNVRDPLRVYRFFKEIGVSYVGFLPLVKRRDDLPGGVSEQTVPPEAYGSFLTTIFDEWVRHDIGRILVQVFDEAARPIRDMEHSLCIFRKTCGDIPVLEHNGDLFSCDHFVDADFRLGNIREAGLAELLRSPAQAQFGREKWESLPRCCLECDVLAMCNGGCPKDRFKRTPDGKEGLNYLCAGFKQFFTYCDPVFKKLVPLWRAGATAELLMEAARGPDRTLATPVHRNDPCPCGSGRKYKRCCLGKSL